MRTRKPPTAQLTAGQEREDFAQQINRQLGIPAPRADDWNTLLWSLADRTRSGPRLIVLDEINCTAMNERQRAIPLYRSHEPAFRTQYSEMKERANAAGALLAGTPGILYKRGGTGRDYWCRVFYPIPGSQAEEFVAAAEDEEAHGTMLDRIAYAAWTVEQVKNLRKLGYQVADKGVASVYCIPIRLPRADRMIWHKLYSSAQRTGSADKAQKDIVQAATLAAIMVEQEGASLRQSSAHAPAAVQAATLSRLPRLESLLEAHPETWTLCSLCMAQAHCNPRKGNDPV